MANYGVFLNYYLTYNGTYSFKTKVFDETGALGGEFGWCSTLFLLED